MDIRESTNSTSLTKKENSRRTLTFDVSNIVNLKHKIHKTKLRQTDTPYPKYQISVDGRQLDEKIVKDASDDTISSSSSNDIYKDQSPKRTIRDRSSIRCCLPADSFEEKRKKFYQNEFTITKQRPLCDEFHPSGNFRLDTEILECDFRPTLASIFMSNRRSMYEKGLSISSSRISLTTVNQQSVRTTRKSLSKLSEKLSFLDKTP